MKPRCDNCYFSGRRGKVRDNKKEHDVVACLRYPPTHEAVKNVCNFTRVLLESRCGEWWPDNNLLNDVGTMMELKESHPYFYYKIKRAIQEGD